MRAFAITVLVAAAAFGWTVGGGRWTSSARTVATAAVASPRTEVSASPTTAASDWQTPHASPGTVVIARGWQGHFFTDGDVAGHSLNFLVDTGATTVALSKAQAAQVGVDVANLTYDRQMMTASGLSNAAAVTLPELRIGDIQLTDVQAVVMDTPSDVALLGESFLGRIDKVSIEGDRMTLTKL